MQAISGGSAGGSAEKPPRGQGGVAAATATGGEAEEGAYESEAYCTLLASKRMTHCTRC